MTLLRNIAYWRKYEKSSKKKFKKISKKSSKKKFEKKFEKMFEKKFAKKVQKYYKLSEGGVGWGGEGGELSFQCLRPSTSLMAAGNKLMGQ
jgi:hypothetical protein